MFHGVAVSFVTVFLCTIVPYLSEVFALPLICLVNGNKRHVLFYITLYVSLLFIYLFGKYL